MKLTNFEGPFDLLLQLIGKHKLDVTEIALSKVTDEFIAHLRALGDELGPRPGQRVPRHRLHAARPEGRPAAARRRRRRRGGSGAAGGPRPAVRPAPAVQGLQAGGGVPAPAGGRGGPRLPPVGGPGAPVRRPGARGAARHDPGAVRRAGRPGADAEGPEVVSVSHLHAPAVSVSEHCWRCATTWCASGTATFRALTADCGHTLEVVARFLALLELYRQQRVVFEQLTPLGELHVRWTGPVTGAGRPAADDGRRRGRRGDAPDGGRR